MERHERIEAIDRARTNEQGDVMHAVETMSLTRVAGARSAVERVVGEQGLRALLGVIAEQIAGAARMRT